MTRPELDLIYQDSTSEPTGWARLCACWTGLMLGSLLIAGCSQLPTSGPTSRQIESSTAGPGAAAIQIVAPATFRLQQDRSSDGGKSWTEGTLRIEAKRIP